jgi:hypothetical protein
MNGPLEAQPFRKFRPALATDAIKHRQDIAAQFRIRFEDMPVDQALSRTDRLLQLSPIVPFRIVQQQQVPNVVRRVPNEVLSCHSGIAVAAVCLRQ